MQSSQYRFNEAGGVAGKRMAKEKTQRGLCALQRVKVMKAFGYSIMLAYRISRNG